MSRSALDRSLNTAKAASSAANSIAKPSRQCRMTLGLNLIQIKQRCQMALPPTRQLLPKTPTPENLDVVSARYSAGGGNRVGFGIGSRFAMGAASDFINARNSGDW